MLPMIASLVGSMSAVVGFGVHMVISAGIGASYALLLGRMSNSFGGGLLWGLIYGLVWWVLGPLLLMPIMMGMGPQFGMAFSQSNLMSLVGHLIFGGIAGVVYAWWSNR
jgi:uncharacterized membrane protein YagU involved in acid resistance